MSEDKAWRLNWLAIHIEETKNQILKYEALLEECKTKLLCERDALRVFTEWEEELRTGKRRRND